MWDRRSVVSFYSENTHTHLLIFNLQKYFSKDINPFSSNLNTSAMNIDQLETRHLVISKTWLKEIHTTSKNLILLFFWKKYNNREILVYKYFSLAEFFIINPFIYICFIINWFCLIAFAQLFSCPKHCLRKVL